jgi:hypothetical protein
MLRGYSAFFANEHRLEMSPSVTGMSEHIEICIKPSYEMTYFMGPTIHNIRLMCAEGYVKLMISNLETGADAFDVFNLYVYC